MPIIHHPAGSGVPECFLLLIDPDWSKDGPKVTYRRSSNQVEGLTGIDDRAANQRASRIRQEANYRFTQQEAADLRSTLATLGGTRVGVPLWCDADRETWIHAPQKVVSWNDGGAYAIIPAGSPVPYAHSAPLLIGRFAERPKLSTDALFESTIAIEEDSPWECRIDSSAGAAPVSFEWEPNYVSSPIDLSRDQLRITELGQGREAAVAGTDGRPRWGQRAQFSLTRDEATDLIRFWNDRDGSVRSFSAPAGRPRTRCRA